MKINVKQIIKKHKLSRWELVRFQILIWCSLRHIQITNAILDMLALLAIIGKTEFTQFCEELTKTELSIGPRKKKSSGKEIEYKYIFNSLQSARNAILKSIEQGLILREHKKHIIELNPLMDIIIENNLLYNFQLLTLESNQG